MFNSSLKRTARFAACALFLCVWTTHKHILSRDFLRYATNFSTRSQH